MKLIRILPAMAFSVLIISFFSCNETDSVIELSHSYTGVLGVEYTKGCPAFTSAARLDVDIQKDGKPATKIKMVGTLVFHEVQGEIMIADRDCFPGRCC